jgi:isopentenyl-diphosphate delta-isomerase
VHDDIEQRKSQHLDLVMREEVEPAGADPLLRCVRLLHRALPELRLADVDITAQLCGKTLQAPLMIVGMTGGTERAGRINRSLAQLAAEEGVAFGVGSMRILLREPQRLSTFDVRPHRPPLLLANLGAQQLLADSSAPLRLIEMLDADGICIHLNPAQELVQPEGDRDFVGCLDAIGRLAEQLGPRLIVKETGCGIGPEVARALWERGVRAIDVSGLGGTSWTRVEQLRAEEPVARALGAQLSDWGLPTAACVLAAAELRLEGLSIIASGGLRSGMDAARAIALGATAGGFALPMLRALELGGLDAARAELRAAAAAVKAACLLVGARNLAELRGSRPVVLDPLRSWIEQLRGRSQNGNTP